MDIKLVSFADKVTGANDATGKISSDDINQIKKILNGIVSALFTLDTSNTATSALVKNTALPAVDIFDGNFNTADFIISGGLISLSNGTSLPAAPPLTAGVADDTANTFSATLPNGYVVTDVERTFDAGATWAAITSLPISVGDVNLAAGQVGLRIKATSEHQHSTTLFNQSAFTSSAGGGDPDADFVAVNSMTIDTDITKTGNSLSWTHTTGNDNRFWSCDTLKVASGSAFEFRFTVNPQQGSCEFGVSQFGSGYKFAKIYWNRESDFHGTFLTFQNGNYQSSGGLNITTAPRARVKGTGTTVTLDYSLDGGTTWIQIDTCTQPAAILQLRGEFIYVNGVATRANNNIIEKGMVAV